MEKLVRLVKGLLGGDKSGHNFEHTARVVKMAGKFAEQEGADAKIVEIAALLHDADDYKVFGEDSAKNLTNAKRIMNDAGIGESDKLAVLDIVSTMGYSKLLAGIRPLTKEGACVSDADMCDAMGAIGIIRVLEYNFTKLGAFTFDKSVLPRLEVTLAEYKENAMVPFGNELVEHFFLKLLKLRDLMMTSGGRAEAEPRHRIMVEFLRHFFEENDAGEWVKLLKNYE